MTDSLAIQLDDVLKNCQHSGYSLLLYAFPNQDKLRGWVQWEAVASRKIQECKLSTGPIVSDFLQEAVIAFNPDWSFEIDDWHGFELDLPERLSPSRANSVLPETIPRATTRSEFHEQVADCIAAIKQGDFEKAVLSRAKIVERPENFNAIDYYFKLLNAYPKAFRYLFYTPEYGCWIGASPELLLETISNTLRTIALAGTQVVVDDGANVEWGAKERKEQGLVSDDIINSLAKCGLLKPEMTGPDTIAAGQLLHLQTKIQHELPANFDYRELLNHLHPTPAVGGLPRSAALDFIHRTETYNRSLYTGFLGWMENGNTKLYVNLRCMQVFQDQLAIYVGAGITAGSDPQKEWEETEAKSKTLLSILS